MINLPIVVPHTAAGIALLLVLGRQSLLGRFFGLLGIRFVDAVPGIVAGMLFVSLPFLVTAARDAIATVDPELERVAEIGGQPVAGGALRDAAHGLAGHHVRRGHDVGARHQ